MKKLSLLLALLALAGSVHATESVYGDLFPYENKHSSFTVDIDAGKLDRLSVEVVFSTEVVRDVTFDVNAIDTTNDTILILSSHSYATAMPVVFSSVPAGAPIPLRTGTTYYVFKVSDTLLKLATTYAQAVSGDTIDITSTVGLSTNTWGLRPIALNTGSAAFSWFGSNDASNWVAVGSVGSSVIGSTQSLVTMGPTSLQARVFDWGEYAYRYLRFTFSGPANGVIKLRAYLAAKTRS